VLFYFIIKMNFQIRLLIVILTLVSSSLCLYGSNSNVIKLDESNFDQLVINSNELWLVEFFAPWCGHCKNLAPEWEKSANALKGIVKVGAVDADAHKSLGGKYGIKGFPTIKWFGLKKNSPKDYEQGRTASEIVKFAVGKITEITNARLTGKTTGDNTSSGHKQQQQQHRKDEGDKNVIVLDDSNFESTVFNSKDMWLVEFYAPWCGHCKNLEPQWNRAATDLKGKIKVAKVDATVNSRIASKYDIKGYPTIKIFPPGEKSESKVENYDGGREADQIVTYSLEKLEKYGYIPEIDQIVNPKQYKEECQDSGKTCVIAFLPHIYESNAVERNRYLDSFKKASTIGRGKPITFLWTQGGDNFDYEEKLGVTFGFPAILLVNHGKKKYTTMKTSFEYENIKGFINRVLIGKEAFYDLPSVIPLFKTVSPWDGQDAKMPTDDL
jgi:protein disulfide-isomerase A6